MQLICATPQQPVTSHCSVSLDGCSRCTKSSVSISTRVNNFIRPISSCVTSPSFVFILQHTVHSQPRNLSKQTSVYSSTRSALYIYLNMYYTDFFFFKPTFNLCWAFFSVFSLSLDQMLINSSLMKKLSVINLHLVFISLLQMVFTHTHKKKKILCRIIFSRPGQKFKGLPW